MSTIRKNSKLNTAFIDFKSYQALKKWEEKAEQAALKAMGEIFNNKSKD